MVKPNALLIGTPGGGPWHPLEAVEGEFRSLLGGDFQLETAVTADRLTALDSYRLVICFADQWETALTDDQMAGISGFLDRGGGVLVVHNGLSYQSRPEFASLVGKRFTGHPPYTRLTFRAVADHPVCRESDPEWALDDEPYRFESVPDCPLTVLHEYLHEGVWYPAAWVRDLPAGRLVYLMPGHTVESFLHPSYRKLLLATARWVSSVV